MKRLALIAGFLVVALAGCASQNRGARATTDTPNLLLGDDPSIGLLAASGPARAHWPSRDTGYRVEDSTYYQIYTYDAQHWYIPNQGTVWTTGESQRVGVLLR